MEAEEMVLRASAARILSDEDDGRAMSLGDSSRVALIFFLIFSPPRPDGSSFS